jgi:CBS domain containing-hemolysin-like protein
MFAVIAIFVVVMMVFFNALYVAAEFAAVSARKDRLSQMADEGNRLAKLLLPIVEDSRVLDNYVATSQVGITVSSLVLGAFGQNVIAGELATLLGRFGSLAEPTALSISVTTVLIFLTTLQVVLGELLPKSLAIQYPERVALWTALPMRWSASLFQLLLRLFNGSTDFLLRILGIRHEVGHRNIYALEEIELLVSESHAGGLLDDQEQQMLRNAFRLRELTARQVMAPRTRLVTAQIGNTVSELLNKACAEGVTRIPLYQANIDDIIGFVHIKDLFRLQLQGEQNPQSILREVVHVPDSVLIADLWRTLTTQKQYIAIIIDEYGGTAGLVTFEDLIEEIFGELQDEFDDEVPLMTSGKDGRIHLRGELLVTDVNEYLNLNLTDDEADTLGGLVFSELGHLPEVGNEVTFGNIIIKVEAMEGRSIAEVSLELPRDGTPYISEWEVTNDS